MKKDRSVWIYFNDEVILMTHDSKAFLYAKFPSGSKMLTLVHYRNGKKVSEKIKLEDLYTKPL